MKMPAEKFVEIEDFHELKFYGVSVSLPLSAGNIKMANPLSNEAFRYIVSVYDADHWIVADAYTKKEATQEQLDWLLAICEARMEE